MPIFHAQGWSHFSTLAFLTLLEGARQRLVVVLLGILLVGLSLAGFAGALAITEAREVRSTLLGAFLRFAAALLTALYVLHSQFRAYHDKGLEQLFSLPLTRTVYLFGKLAGYGLLIMIMVGLFSGVLLFFAPPLQVALWGGSLLLELWIVAAFSFWVQLTIRSFPAAFLMVLFFYVLARTLTSLQLVGQGVIMPQHSPYFQAINAVLAAIGFILPGLDRFTQSEWLAYGSGQWEDLLFVCGQGVIYLILLAALALIDLYRKSL
ncbi:MAG: ABC transporter permease [Magnetococcales bacterium]|nr:ABC transporter permease [Magnetococcales bacterium]